MDLANIHLPLENATILCEPGKFSLWGSGWVLKHCESSRSVNIFLPQSLVFAWEGACLAYLVETSPTQTRIALCLFLCLLALASGILVPKLWSSVFALKNSLYLKGVFFSSFPCPWKYKCQIPLWFCTVSISFSLSWWYFCRYNFFKTLWGFYELFCCSLHSKKLTSTNLFEIARAPHEAAMR